MQTQGWGHSEVGIARAGFKKQSNRGEGRAQTRYSERRMAILEGVDVALPCREKCAQDFLHAACEWPV